MAGRPGKYAHVTQQLPRLDGVEPERRTIVDAVRTEILAAEPHAYNLDAQAKKMLEDIDDSVGLVIDLVKTVAAGQRQSAALAKGYAASRYLKERVEAWRASVQLLLDAYEGLMLEQMEADGVASLRLASGQSVSTFLEPYATVKDPEALRAWALADPDLRRKLSLPWATVNALNKERLLAGDAPPPGVETYAKPTVRLNS